MKVESCPVCSANLKADEYVNEIFVQQNFYCKSCDSFHIAEEKDMSEYYSDEYHADFNFKKYKKTTLLKDYFSKPRNYARFNYLSKHIGEKQISNILEIGGGNGDFFSLTDAKWRPKRYTIVEPNPSYNLEAENLHYHNALFENVPDEELAEIGLIVMFHVLEHIFDVDAFLDRIKRLGVKHLFFEVPNIADERVKMDSLLKHPHYHHYSEESLRQLLIKNGLNKFKITSIRPVTYHPYKKINPISRVFNKLTGRNEVVDPKGLYLRALIDLS